MRRGQGEVRTILLLHIISVRPSKQPLMVRTFLKVYVELGSYFLFLQEQIKDIIICVKCLFLRSPSRAPDRTPPVLVFVSERTNKRHHHHHRAPTGRPTRTPPRSPRPRIHRHPDGLPWTAQHYCLGGSGPNCFQALGSSPGLLPNPIL